MAHYWSVSRMLTAIPCGLFLQKNMCMLQKDIKYILRMFTLARVQVLSKNIETDHFTNIEKYHYKIAGTCDKNIG